MLELVPLLSQSLSLFSLRLQAVAWCMSLHAGRVRSGPGGPPPGHLTLPNNGRRAPQKVRPDVAKQWPTGPSAWRTTPRALAHMLLAGTVGPWAPASEV